VDGVFGNIFVEHGAGYQAENPKGVQPEPFIIKKITNDDPAVVTLVEAPSSMLGDDSMIQLLDVPGMPGLTNQIFQIFDLRTQTEFTLDLSGPQLPPFDETANGGHGIQYFNPLSVNFLPYLESLQRIKEESLIMFDQLHFERDQQIIIAYAAIRRALETTDNIADVPIERILDFIQNINGADPENPLLEEGFDESMLRELIRQFGIVISPTASVVGGIVA
jgi:hypothetical protein